MTYVNAVKYLASLPSESTGANLRSVAECISPSCLSIPSVHISGSAGKNSTSRMLASILAKQGLKAGCYSLHRGDEMRSAISVDQKPVSYETFADTVSQVIFGCAKADIGAQPSADDILALAALLIFEDQACDIAIFEKSLTSGSGANVAYPPLVNVITHISSGDEPIINFSSVFRKGTRETVLFRQGDIYNTFAGKCERLNQTNICTPISAGLFKSAFSYADRSYTIRAFAPCQTDNAVTAIETVNALNRAGFEITEKSIADGLASATLPNKCEILSHTPTVIMATASEHDHIHQLALSADAVKAQLGDRINVFLDPMCTANIHSEFNAVGITSSVCVIDTSLTPSRFEKSIRENIKINAELPIFFICSDTLAPKVSGIIKKSLGGI